MENLRALASFFDAIKNDGRVNTTHIGIYAALLMYWQQNGCTNPISAFSWQINVLAKISARTYRKCLAELSEYGYLRYVPSLKRNRASEIYLRSYDE